LGAAARARPAVAAATTLFILRRLRGGVRDGWVVMVGVVTPQARESEPLAKRGGDAPQRGACAAAGGKTRRRGRPAGSGAGTHGGGVGEWTVSSTHPRNVRRIPT
jgi:hypothetical protein